MSDAFDAVQDFTTGLFDFATSPFRAIGSVLSPNINVPTPASVPTPGISDVAGRRDALRAQAGREGRQSLILSRPRSGGGNTGMRPRGGTTIGGGAPE